MCVVSLTFSTIYAQTPEPKLTLKLTNNQLSEVIRQIEQDTGFSFIYGEEVKLDHKVSLNVQKKPLREVLNLLFANKPISYKITGKHILLQKNAPQTRKPEVHCQWIRDRRSVCRNADWCKYS